MKRTKLIIKQSPINGYGVFADRVFLPGDIVEESVVLSFSDRLPDPLENYCFQFKKSVVLPLGFGALYNHSEKNNAIYEYDEERRCITFRAVRAIQPGDEIFISYGKDWFSSRKLKSKQTTLRFKLRKMIAAIPPSVFRFVLCVSAILTLVLSFG